MKIYPPRKIMPPSGVALGIYDIPWGNKYPISPSNTINVCNFLFSATYSREEGCSMINWLKNLVKPISFGCFLPLNPHRALHWTHWGPYGGPQTPDRFMRTHCFHSGYVPDSPWEFTAKFTIYRTYLHISLTYTIWQ